MRTNLRTHHASAPSCPAGDPTRATASTASRRIADGKLIHTAENQILGGALTAAIEYAVALVGMTAMSVVIGWLLAGRALAPLREITATARRVSSENLGERIAHLPGPADELRELADTFDGMLERLDGAFASQRHFVANASHELRTPLAIMRTEVDVRFADPEYASVGGLAGHGRGRTCAPSTAASASSPACCCWRAARPPPARRSPWTIAALAADCVTDLWARAEEAQIEIRDDLEPAWTTGHPACWNG